MGFEDSDGVTHRFNYCRPATTRNFCCTSDRGFSFICTPLHPNYSQPSLSIASLRLSLDFLRAPIFPPFLPEPQNGAKIRYRFAEPGLAADRATDLPGTGYGFDEKIFDFSFPFFTAFFHLDLHVAPISCVDESFLRERRLSGTCLVHRASYTHGGSRKNAQMRTLKN